MVTFTEFWNIWFVNKAGKATHTDVLMFNCSSPSFSSSFVHPKDNLVLTYFLDIVQENIFNQYHTKGSAAILNITTGVMRS